MAEQNTIAVIGAGVIGSSIACALASEGRRVLLIDRAPPGEAGASFGNAGHIATELLEPLPSPGLLFGFWRIADRLWRPAAHPGAARAAIHALGDALRRGRLSPRARTHFFFALSYARPSMPSSPCCATLAVPTCCAGTATMSCG